MKFLSVTIQMKATKQCFPVMLFIMLYKVILTFESVDEILNTEVLICQSVDEQECKPLYPTFPFPPRLTDQRLYISLPTLCSLSCKDANKKKTVTP